MTSPKGRTARPTSLQVLIFPPSSAESLFEASLLFYFKRLLHDIIHQYFANTHLWFGKAASVVNTAHLFATTVESGTVDLSLWHLWQIE